jgi:hypothetical protein
LSFKSWNPRHNVQMSQEKLRSHLNALSLLKLPSFSDSEELKDVAEVMMKDVKGKDGIKSLLEQALHNLASDAQRKREHRLVSHSIKSKDERSQHFIIDPTTKRKPYNGTKLIKKAIQNLKDRLKDSQPYEPISMTTEDLVLDQQNNCCRYIRNQVKNSIIHGDLKQSICLHVFSYGGSEPDILTIFKIQTKVARGDKHTDKFHIALKKCEANAPQLELKQTVKKVVQFMSTYGGKLKRDISCEAIESIITNEKIKKEELDVLLYSGFFNDDLLQDMRKLNSRGGMGDGGTTFQAFFAKCENILRSDGGVHERRKVDSNDILYGSSVTSISDLKRKAIESLQNDLASGVFDELPPVPSEELLRLQLYPNNATTKASEKMTGRFKFKRGIQLRTLRKSHPDQHFVNALTRYIKEWTIDCKLYSGIGRSKVAFVGQDDKAKIPVGDSIAVSTNVRAKNCAIISTEKDEDRNKAADHDWSTGSITPSVTLFSNIPDNYDGSFYSGGENGFGEVHVTSRDSVFDSSDVFDHCAQLYEILANKKVEDDDNSSNPKSYAETLCALVLQTDGGSDHNIKFLRTKLALISLFQKLDVDHFVVLRGAPYGSFLNVAERAMSLLNIGLQNVALVRDQMADWAEIEVTNAGSMAGIRRRHEEIQKSELNLEMSRREKVRPAMSNDIRKVHIEGRLGISVKKIGRYIRVEKIGDPHREHLFNVGDRIVSLNDVELIDIDLTTFADMLKVQKVSTFGLQFLVDTRKSITSYMKANSNSNSVEERAENRASTVSIPKNIVSNSMSCNQLPIERNTIISDSTSNQRIGHKNISNIRCDEREDSSVCCSYSTINACKFVLSNMKLDKCAEEHCSRMLHHLCQIEYCCLNGLEETREVRVCHHHITNYYKRKDSLVAADSRFVLPAHTSTAAASSSNIPHPPDLPLNQQVRNQETAAVASADPLQSRFCLSTKVGTQRNMKRDLKKEYTKSMELPIHQVNQRFRSLCLEGRPVKADDRCSSNIVESLHSILHGLDESYDRKIREASRFHSMPQLKLFFDNHSIVTPYCISFQKCGKESCPCGPYRSKEGAMRDLVLQHQPMPILNPSHPGHFYSREEALKLFPKSKNAHVNLKDLPSNQKQREDNQKKKEKAKVDTANGKNVSKWAATSVRSVVKCIDCGKPRCMFSKKKLSTKQISDLELYVEYHQFVCGERLFLEDEEEHYLKNIVFHRVNITCYDSIEKQFYNPSNGKRQAFVTPITCARCASTRNVKENDDLEKMNLTDGYLCLPLCEVCINANVSPAHNGKTKQDKMKYKKQATAKKEEIGKKRKNDKQGLDKRKKQK